MNVKQRVSPTCLVVGLLLLAGSIVQGGGMATDQHDCKRLCDSVIPSLSDLQTLGSVAACEEGCITISHCHHQHYLEEKDKDVTYDESNSCLTKCENSCTELYGASMDLVPACVGGCKVKQSQMDDSGTFADAQYLSQRVEILEDAGPGIGIKENKTHNVSLNLGGSIETNVTSNTFIGPKINKNGISTRGRKKVEDKTIKFDLQGDIDNGTISEQTLSKHGKKGVVAYGKRGKEYSENASINIQGILSRNGSYIDVSSKYNPLVKKLFRSRSVRRRAPRRRRSPRRMKGSKKAFGRRLQDKKVQDRKSTKHTAKDLGTKPKSQELGKAMPREGGKVVKKPLAGNKSKGLETLQ